MKRKAISITLALCLLISTFAVGVITPASASTGSSDSQYAQDTVSGSAVLHCFNWSYNNIKANLSAIREAGYTAVQTSPVQAPKDYASSYTNQSEQWWKLYQPLGLSVANGNNWLGTRAELKALCDAAEDYGIKVIADIVANHVANGGTDGGTYDYVNSAMDSNLKNRNYFHTNNIRVNDNSRYEMTQYHLGMPDLNTGNSTVQSIALNFLKDCVDLGIDGFRFDAAKHIELPTDDSSCRSDFWPTVLGGVNSYKSGLFSYGEILGGAGTDISNYTNYMAITDNYTGDLALDKTYWQYAPELADSAYYKGASPSNSVLWVESHDTYMGSSGSAWTGNTSGVSDDVITRAWAIVGSRADSTALYFARPATNMGSASSDTNWKSTAVAEVNKFKNYFDGTSEYLAYSGTTVAYNERGTKGVVISKLDGSGSVSLTSHQMSDGTYYDQITGNKFTVSGGTISGTVGSTGVAVVYNPEGSSGTTSATGSSTASTQSGYYLRGSFNSWSADDNSAMYTTSDSDVVTKTLTLDAGTYTFKVNNGDTWYGNGGTIEDTTTKTSSIGWEMDASAGDCTLTASGGTYTFNFNTSTNYLTILYSSNEETTAAPATEAAETTAPTTAVPTTVEPTTVAPVTAAATSSTSNTVKFSNNQNWSSVYIYAWNSDDTDNRNADWPGVTMTQIGANDYGEEQYSATIDSAYDRIIFNNGGSSQTVDITYDGSVTGYYPQSQTSGKWTVGTWTEEATEAPTTVAPTTVAPTTVEPTTIAPTTVEPTTVEPTTIAPTTVEPTTVAPTTEAPVKTYTYYYVPLAKNEAAGYTFKLNINDEYGTAGENWHQYTMTKTSDTVGGVPVYTVTFTANYEKANEIQFQTWNGDTWIDQTDIDNTNKIELSALDGKIVKTDSSINEYEVDVETTAAPTTIAPTTVAPTTVEPTTVEPATEAPATYNTVLFTNNQNWSKVYLYAWNDDESNASWPGVELTETTTNSYGETQYIATFDSKYTNLIFSNNSEQTVDIKYSEVAGYYPTQKNSEGKWEVGTWTEEATEAPTTVEPTTIAPTTVEPTTVEPTTIAPTTVEPTTVAPTIEPATEPAIEPETQAPLDPKEYYTTSDGNSIKLSDTVSRDEEDTYLSGIGSEFKNIQILGVQTKTDKVNRSVRFVSVINNEIASDAEDYGYIAVGSTTIDSARSIVESYTLDKAPAKNVFSCKGKDNRISGDYGKSDSDTTYKYVTFAVNNIGENAVAVMFYVKDKNGNTYYAPYTNSKSITYNSCSTDWASLIN